MPAQNHPVLLTFPSFSDILSLIQVWNYSESQEKIHLIYGAIKLEREEKILWSKGYADQLKRSWDFIAIIIISLLLRPDQTYHSFRAKKSVDQSILLRNLYRWIFQNCEILDRVLLLLVYTHFLNAFSIHPLCCSNAPNLARERYLAKIFDS